MRKKIVSILLTLAMVVALVPSFSLEAEAVIGLLYFGKYGGEDSTRQLEYSIYQNGNKTIIYQDDQECWNVQWVDNKGACLNITDFDIPQPLRIDKSCVINVSGQNNIPGILISDGAEVVFEGDGTLNITNGFMINENTKIDGPEIICDCTVTVASGVKAEIASGTITENEETYPGDTLYLAKKESMDYALYADEALKFEYSQDKGTSWDVTEETYAGQNYAVLQLEGELDKNVTFKQDSTKAYTSVLRVNGTDAKLGGFDASEGTLTIQGDNAKKATVTGDIKAQKLYMSECNGFEMELIDASIIAAQKDGVDNEIIIASDSNENQTKVTIKNGYIDNEKGVISLVNADVNIGENDEEAAASFGLNAHSIILDSSKLTINDVATGVKLFDPKNTDTEGSMMSLNNKSSVAIDAEEIGVSGTLGQNYYNNICVSDDESDITVEGGTKAVSSVNFAPLPENKVVRSIDGKSVYFKVNEDEESTSDYYFAGTTTPAKGLTLGEKCTYKAPLEEGENVLLLGNKDAGTFNILKDGCKGFKLQYEDGKYVYVSGNSVVKSNDSFTWKYDGGLYTEVKTKVTKKFLFWKKTAYRTAKYYLGFEDGQFVLSAEKVDAQVHITSNEHTYTYLHDNDGKHEAVCTKCGKHEEAVEHDYTFDEENHKCICGKIDPDYCFVKDIKVTEKKTTKTTGFWFFKKTVTKYQYIIEPKTQNVAACKVEYSGNFEDWDTGTEFFSDVKLNKFFIRVTDTNGKVTNWKYKDGDIYKAYSISYEETDKWDADESNPTFCWGDETATLKFSTYENEISGDEIVAENAHIDSWVQNDEYTQGTLVISNPESDITIAYQGNSCFVKGTKVTMADGSLKNIEDISVGDEVLTFNHETGKYEAQKVYYFYTSPEPVKTITLHFSEGEDLTLNMHYFFIKESLKYELVTRQNAKEFVGKHFYNSDLGKYVVLERVEYGNELTDVYAINTEYNENSLANGFLSLPDDVGFRLNIYTFDENLLADKDALAADIEKYGLIEYWEEAVFSKEDYDRFQIKYNYIAIGKGLITSEKLYEMQEAMFGE